MVEQYKSFEELSLKELYTVLQLRSEIFVVEQNCVYQDLDGEDYRAIHFLCTSDQNKGDLVAYCRIFMPESKQEEAKIGRVLVKEEHRTAGYGRKMMMSAMKWINQQGVDKMRLEAQTYLIGFYSSLGFEAQGEEYLEDGIPHISMALRPQ